MIFIKRDFEAYLDEMDKITIILPKEIHQGESSTFSLLYGKTTTELIIIEKIPLPNNMKYVCKTEARVLIGDKYMVKDEHNRITDLQIGAVIRTESFDQAFHYEKDDLGFAYQKTETAFTLWAPTASSVKIKLLAQNITEPILYSLTRGDKGTWRITVKGDLEGYRYTYLVCVNLIWREAIDPYTPASSINSGAGIIINEEKASIPKVPLLPFKEVTDAIIYELHVRDFSSHSKSGMNYKGKYAAFSEIPPISECGKTGLPYLLDLGVTHVELLPVNDYGGVDERNPNESYNWGYNPLLFNVPEGSYATNPEDPYSRIIELKELINTFHQQNVRVILDVVYNHVFIREDSSFEKIVPGYFFRHDDHGMPSNGTGVGNDLASERKMVRKFIIDSVKYWLKTYDVDGFRFDLMGILDIDTMNLIHQEVRAIKPDVIILGEGWDLNTPLASEKKAMIKNAKNMPNIAFFNDMFRDSIKGSTFNLFDRGFALGNNHKISFMKQTLSGSIPFEAGVNGLFNEPIQTINYVESHDNHTLWDKINLSNQHEDEETRRKRHTLATSIVLLSQGIPFLHAGQEFFRTKNGEENSYKSPDSINGLDWGRKHLFEDNVDFIKGLIQLRKSHKAFRLSSTTEIQQHLKFPLVKPNLIMCHLHEVSKYGKWNHILILFHNGLQAENISLPGEGEWELLVNNKQASEIPFAKLNRNIAIEPISTVVLARN
ncbi:type I pullulanase [Sutcliffiella rhizosphaerae]|uniref:Pullulanase n=1 Tax=Sutcliffiella rhizosphaerae TaxID=2880967 RepID=A0ABN8AAB7_9BACI|nr:type I pullulanase [Sutcliffiella rhizosphaerae]CAG9622140.1 Pullulanase [Sutcliffiella rhizosphaerae]